MVTMISGRHMDVGESLQEYVNSRIDLGIKKYLHDITQAKVVFSKHSYLYHVDVTIHDSHIGLIRAENESDDVYAAFDTAIVKIEKQLRKYKSKIKKHTHSKSIKDNTVDDIMFLGRKYVLNMPQTEQYEQQDHHEPITIAEHDARIEKLTVSEAIMKMDLAHLSALMFINRSNNRINMVYHRSDGNISWVDPGEIKL